MNKLGKKLSQLKLECRDQQILSSLFSITLINISSQHFFNLNNLRDAVCSC